MEKTTTGTLSDTVYVSQALWKGKVVIVQHSDEDKTLNCKHKLVVMHHYGENGKHYCPTMFLSCCHCGGVAEEPEPYECNRWGN